MRKVSAVERIRLVSFQEITRERKKKRVFGSPTKDFHTFAISNEPNPIHSI